MIHPIYIPSKKRPNGKTFALLNEAGLHRTVFVEKEDAESYAANSGNETRFFILEKSNQGIAYVRQVIKNYTEKFNDEWYWCLDDDIASFHECQSDGKLVEVPTRQALQDAQNIIEGLKVAQGAINYAQFSFGEGKIFSLNKRCLIATLNNVEKLRPFRYDPNCKLKEDIDFTMQILTSGNRTVLCNKIGFKVPVYGSSKGGCYETYQQERIEKTMSEYLEQKWGRNLIVKVLKDNGRYDVKINWNAFK